MYTRGNPLKYSDPSGHANCQTNSGSVDWDCRWFTARGYDLVNGVWTAGFQASFFDPGALMELLADSGIQVSTISGIAWGAGELELMGQGVAALAQKLGGTSAVKGLLPTWTILMRAANPTSARDANCHTGAAAACTFSVPLGPTSLIQIYDATFSSDSFARGVIVHELAHAMDFRSGGLFSNKIDQTPGGIRNPLTNYTDNPVTNKFAPDVEYWAEAVSRYVFGSAYRSGDAIHGALTADQTLFVEQMLGVR